MENLISPSQHIYKLYDEYEKRGMDTSPISQAIQQATGTNGMSNLEVAEQWLKEIADSKICRLF